MSRQASRGWAALAMAAAFALPATTGFAQLPGGAAPAHPAASGPRKPVGGHVDTLSAVETSLRSGYHAVLLLGIEPLDSKICRIFVNTYGDSFVLETEKVIYFTKRTTYSDPTIKCDQLAAAYDSQILFDLNEGDLLSGLPTAPTLMIVCRDPRGELVNKGYVLFSQRDGDNVVQRRFAAFDSYYRKGPAGWEDGKLIDGSLDLLDSIKNLIFFRSAKNTPCR
jgi:hypothetical protein